MPYNLTQMDGRTDILQLFIGIQSMLPDQFKFIIGIFILISFFVIYLMYFYRSDITQVLIYDGILTTILAILLWGAGMVQANVIIYPALIAFIGTIMYFFS